MSESYVSNRNPKLYRSSNFNVLGGVCSGFAMSRGLSISLVRVLFLFFGSITGILFLLYILAWLLIPSAEKVGVNEGTVAINDPFRRNLSDAKVAGVCSGIAAILKTDVTLVRIAFALAFICAGVGLIPYLYAWIIVPSEKTVF